MALAPLLLSDLAVKLGVYIDSGQWFPGVSEYGFKGTEDPPVFMWKGNSYSEAEARSRGWVKKK